MIEKGKIVHFYTWHKEGRKIQVIGEMLPSRGQGLSFSFYVNKEKIPDPEHAIEKEFINELRYTK